MTKAINFKSGEENGNALSFAHEGVWPLDGEGPDAVFVYPYDNIALLVEELLADVLWLVLLLVEIILEQPKSLFLVALLELLLEWDDLEEPDLQAK